MIRFSLIVVHGAGSGPWVFEGWVQTFPDAELTALDLHSDLDIESASMEDYARKLVEVTEGAKAPVVVVGWSMGGLVALMGSRTLSPDGLILLEPSPPSETQGTDHSVEPQEGSFDPEAVYGPFPSGMHARPESQFARDERKRGISVPAIDCPCLVVSGREFPEERGDKIAQLYGAELAVFGQLDHWDLVRSREVREAVRDWIASRVMPAT